MRTRRGEQGLVRIAKGGVCDCHRVPSPHTGGELLWADILKQLARARGRRRRHFDLRKLRGRINDRGGSTVRLIHRDVGKVSEQPAPAITGRSCLQQLGVALDE